MSLMEDGRRKDEKDKDGEGREKKLTALGFHH